MRCVPRTRTFLDMCDVILISAMKVVTSMASDSNLDRKQHTTTRLILHAI